MEEIWKDIKGFEGLYQISNLGNLRSFATGEWYTRRNVNKTGWYFNVVLKSKTNYRSVKIHKLVAEAFIPNPENKPCINHIDGNKQNNRVDNLEWCTAKENFNHAKQKGLWVYNKPYKQTRVGQFDKTGNLIEVFQSAKEASNKTGVCARNILQVANKEPFNKKGNVRKQAGGFIWKLV